MLEIAICEDEQADRERLQGMLYAILDKYNMERQITCYSSGEELLGSGVQFQLIFMDIVMEDFFLSSVITIIDLGNS